MKYLPIAIRLTLTIAILVVVWLNAHWSVAVALTFISVATEGISALLIKLRKAVKAVDQKHESLVRDLNEQAERMQQKMNVCRECQYHPTGVRPGSIHNRNAPNCLMYEKHESKT